jgi:phosphinothricin acetyltransferase
MMRIRSARESDLPEILVIYNDIILTTTAIYQYQPQSPEMRRSWFDARHHDGHPIFVAESEGRIVGFSTYGPFRAWPAYKYTVENSVYVAAAERGKGIGKILIPPLIAAAKAADLHAMIASVDAGNMASLRLHRSFGFEEVAHFRQVGYKFGRWLDLKFLELLLETPEHPVEG